MRRETRGSPDLVHARTNQHTSPSSASPNASSVFVTNLQLETSATDRLKQFEGPAACWCRRTEALSEDELRGACGRRAGAGWSFLEKSTTGRLDDPEGAVGPGIAVLTHPLAKRNGETMRLLAAWLRQIMLGGALAERERVWCRLRRALAPCA